MYIYIYICIHIYKCLSIYVYICVYIYIYIHTRINCIYICTYFVTGHEFQDVITCIDLQCVAVCIYTELESKMYMALQLFKGIFERLGNLCIYIYTYVYM